MNDIFELVVTASRAEVELEEVKHNSKNRNEACFMPLKSLVAHRS
jgi:hypothetical protein